MYFKVGDKVTHKDATIEPLNGKYFTVVDASGSFCYIEGCIGGYDRSIGSSGFFRNLRFLSMDTLEFYIGQNKSSSETDGVGRYFKALKDEPQSIPMKEGDYGFCPRKGYLNFNSSHNWSFTYTPENYEMMPEGFTPPSENEMVDGEYYYVFDKHFWMIGKSKGSVRKHGTRRDGDVHYMISQEQDFMKATTWCCKSDSGRDFRKATQEEIDWLDACVKADGYVPKEDSFAKQVYKSPPKTKLKTKTVEPTVKEKESITLLTEGEPLQHLKIEEEQSITLIQTKSSITINQNY